MKADWRISIKDYRRKKTLKVTLTRAIFTPAVLCPQEWPALAQRGKAGLADARLDRVAQGAGESGGRCQRSMTNKKREAGTCRPLSWDAASVTTTDA